MEITRPYSPTARLLAAVTQTSFPKGAARLLLGIVLTAGLLGGAGFGAIARAQSERECGGAGVGAPEPPAEKFGQKRKGEGGQKS